jgi:hypothetical protein
MRIGSAVAIALAATAALVARADDWPRFRGPNGSGIALNANVPTDWGDARNLRWKTALPGRGSSSPIVCDERVLVTCYSGCGDVSAGGSTDKLRRHLICLDRSTGKILWEKTVPADLPEDLYVGNLTEHGYASHTPATDGQRVYAFFGKSGVLTFDFSGTQLWQVNVGKQSGNRRWGSAASLLVYKNLVIVNAAEESRSIRALDALTGKQIWNIPAEGLELCYSTPLLVEADNGRTDLVLAVAGEVWALNPDTGKLRWFAVTGIEGNLSPSVVAADNTIFITGGFPRQGTVAVRGGGKDDVTKTNVLWSSQAASYVPSPVVQGGNLYFVSDQGFATCLDARTGNVLRRERLPGLTGAGRGGPVYASTILAGGRLYAVSRRKGTFVLDATPQMPVVAHNSFSGDDSDFNATPAISGRQIFMRSNRFLYCVQAEAK